MAGTSGQENLDKLYGALKYAERQGLHDGQSFGDWYTTTSFTDHIAVGSPITDDAEDELAILLYETAFYQQALARQGLFTRGGFTIGPAFLGEGFAFGSAIVQAYLIESTIAKYPRVVIGKPVLPYIRHHLGYWGDPSWSAYAHFLLRDQDGNMFLNYLSIVDPEEIRNPYAEMAVHKSHVEAGLKEFRRKHDILDKYEWLASLHNYWCHQAFANKPGLLIDIPPRRRKMIQPIKRRLRPPSSL